MGIKSTTRHEYSVSGERVLFEWWVWSLTCPITTGHRPNSYSPARSTPTRLTSYLEVFIRVIGSVSEGCHSVRLYFGFVIFRFHVAAGTFGSGRLVTVRLKTGYSSYRVCIGSVSVEVCVE